MPRPYGQTEYVEMGLKHGLNFLGPLPVSVGEKTRWECKVCGKIHTKTFRAVALRENSCTCGKALQAASYVQLAKDMNIVWVENQLTPSNTKALTNWFAPETGITFAASYSDLKWRLNNDLKQKIGLPIRQRGGWRGKKRAVEAS